MQKPMRRQVALLVPIFALPGGIGIGDTGQALLEAIDFCVNFGFGAFAISAAQRHWQ